MSTMKIKKGDTVRVITGKDKGKDGKVLSVNKEKSTVIVENVNIGNSVTIGAGAVVTKDIPDNATAAGNYAKVLNYTRPGRFIANQWTIK